MRRKPKPQPVQELPQPEQELTQPSRPPQPIGCAALLLTLKRTPERTAEALAQLAQEPLPITIIWGCDAREPGALDYLPICAGTIRQAGEHALCETWKRALGHIVRRNLAWAIIYEDDVERVARGAADAVAALPAGWHIAALHDQHVPGVDWLDEIAGPLRRCRGTAYQAHAIAVSQAGARALLAALSVISEPFDVVTRHDVGTLSVWQCTEGRGFYRQTNTRPSEVRAAQGGKIPRIIHQIWTGPKPLPAEYAGYVRRWKMLHPGWTHKLWTDADLAAHWPGMDPARWGKTEAARSDMWRLLILAKFGGLYVDTDFEPFRAFDPLVAGASLLAARIEPPAHADNTILNGLLAAEPGHPLILRMIEEGERGCATGLHILAAAGPEMVTRVLGPIQQLFRKFVRVGGQEVGILYADTGVVILHQTTVYPYLWHHSRPQTYPATAWAAHHWAASWCPPVANPPAVRNPYASPYPYS